MEAKVGKIDAVLESKENAPNQAKDQTVADPQGSYWDDAKAKIVADTKANQKAITDAPKANIAYPKVKIWKIQRPLLIKNPWEAKKKVANPMEDITNPWEAKQKKVMNP